MKSFSLFKMADIITVHYGKKLVFDGKRFSLVTFLKILQSLTLLPLAMNFQFQETYQTPQM